MRAFRRATLAACALLCAAQAPAPGLRLAAPGLAEGALVPASHVYDRHGCGGGNASPALVWGAVPAGTRSLAVTLFDPDARHGAGWWHWAVFDVPATARGLQAGAGAPGSAALPPGAAQGRNSFGDAAYDGPCPPPGDAPHHYVFTLWALGTARLGLPAGAPDAAVLAALRHHALARATLMLRYGR